MNLTLSECNPFTYAGQNSSSLFAFSEDWNGIPDVAVKLVIIAFCLSDWVDVWDTFCLNVTKTLIPNPTGPGQDMVPMALPRFQRLRRRNLSRLWRRCHLLPQIWEESDLHRCLSVLVRDGRRSANQSHRRKRQKRIRKDFFQQRSAREEPNNSSSSNYPDHRQLHPGLHHRVFVLQEPKKNHGRTSNQNCHDQRTSRINEHWWLEDPFFGAWRISSGGCLPQGLQSSNENCWRTWVCVKVKIDCPTSCRINQEASIDFVKNRKVMLVPWILVSWARQCHQLLFTEGERAD